MSQIQKNFFSFHGVFSNIFLKISPNINNVQDFPVYSNFSRIFFKTQNLLIFAKITQKHHFSKSVF